MDKFRITGGRAVRGRIGISGAKNSALPCMAAALLTGESVTLHNVPYVRDIITQRRLLEDLGAHVLTPELRTHKITAAHIELFEAPYDLVKTMRASVLVLGPLLARFGKAKVSLPGGCAIGSRPIDLHLESLKVLGAEVNLEAGYVVARAPKGGRLRGADVHFDKGDRDGHGESVDGRRARQWPHDAQQCGARTGSGRPRRTFEPHGRAHSRRGLADHHD
jgi:UDP-N-acetylglucosamine 1-carboxyvinyltransferase